MRQPFERFSIFSHQRILIRNGLDDRTRLFDAGFLLLNDDGDRLGYAVEILCVQASCGGRGGSETDSAGHERRSLLIGDRVLVGRNVRLVQKLFNLLAGKARAGQVDEHKVVVCAAGDDVDASGLQSLAKCLRVIENVLRVNLEGRIKSFLEADSLYST